MGTKTPELQWNEGLAVVLESMYYLRSLAQCDGCSHMKDKGVQMP